MKMEMLRSKIAWCAGVLVVASVLMVPTGTVGIAFLLPDEQLMMRGLSTVKIQNGPGMVYFTPFITRTIKRKGVQLDERQYMVVTHELSGVEKSVAGPQLYFPAAHEVCDEPRPKIVLEQHQYAKLVDRGTGAVRVERGEKIIVPKPHERPADNAHPVHDAVNVDEETAVLVLSRQSGQQRLVTARGLFFPDWHEEILEVRKLIRVEPHEVAVVRDNDGAFHFHTGADTGDGHGTAFFLPPHHELVTMYWSSGTSPDDIRNNIVKNAKDVKYKVPMTKIDLRSQYAFFEYRVRTSDNVELVLEGTIFWQVVDVPRMIDRTSDPKGDVWYHARSALIQAVSAVTLEEFMASFNSMASRAATTDGPFYEQRGVRLHDLEIVRYECEDGRTADVLHEIIQETTNRINSLQKQRSENEVERERLQAQIELERERKELIEARTANEKLQASSQGESEGTRLAQNSFAFLDQLSEQVPDNETRLALLRFFSEQRTLTEQTEHLSQGSASLFLTPQDMNLKLQMPTAGTQAL